MHRLPALLAVAAAALLAGCGGSSSPSSEQPATPTATAAGDAGCQTVRAPGPKPQPELPKPRQKLDPAQAYVATISTSCGDFDITLDARNSPKTGGSFQYLADRGFFDGTTFHRVIAGFVIQGGDPKGDGTGGPGYSVVEAPPRSTKYARGVVAMAKTQTEAPGTSGSQFFVVTGEDARLPPDYAVLGKVTRGQDVVDRIGVVPVDPSTDRPVDPVVIRTVKVAVR